jgi:predicted PurR-regulated permease PerM
VSLAVWIAIAIAVVAILLLLLVLVRLVGPLRQLQAQVLTVQGKLDDVQALQARVDQINGALSEVNRDTISWPIRAIPRQRSLERPSGRTMGRAALAGQSPAVGVKP